PHDRIGYFV
ncbi:unnamed protein product, partial [Allacma fusca]